MVMTKNLEISILFDFYGDLLTDKQKEVIELYYNEDLSLGEIAENANITRQGVRDAIKRGEVFLLETEEKLGFSKHFNELSQKLSKIKEEVENISSINSKTIYNSEIDLRVKEILKLLLEIDE
jgi:uncharacterized protein